MRARLLIAGAIVLVIGLLFAFVPFIPQVSTYLPTNSPRTTLFHGYEWNLTGFSITGRIPVSLSWTSNLPVNTTIEICPSDGFNTNFACVGAPSWPGNGSGQSGSDSFSVVAGSTVLIAMYGSNQSQGFISGHVTNGSVALIILVVGIVLLILGVVLKRKKKAESPPSPPVPTDSPAGPPTP